MTNKPEQLPEWRKALNEAVENYQSTRAWYEENQDSPSAEQDMDAAAGEIEKLIKQYGVLIVLNLLDEIDELQERRKADSEPVGWTDEEELRDVEKDGCGYLFKANPISPNSDPRRVIKLYRHSQTAQEVPDDLLSMAASAIEDLLEHTDPSTSYYSSVWADVPGKLRAAIQSFGNSEQLDEVGSWNNHINTPTAKPAIDTGELLKHIEGMEVSVDVSTCDADAGHRYFGTVTEISELDTAKNGYILLVQDAKPNFKQAANSTVTPDGWQLVPKEPTQAMNKAGWDAMNEHDAINPTYRAMLAAAPKQENF